MIEYTVTVGVNGTKFWYLNDRLHCEHGPAIEWANGVTRHFLNGVGLSKAEWKKRMNKSCSGKVVVFEGVSYKLVEV